MKTPPPFLLTDPEQVNRSPINYSVTKQMFSIPKAKRFTEITLPKCKQAFYDLPPLKDTRTTCMGYGSRYDFTKSRLVNPGPTTYSHKTFLEAELQESRGWTFPKQDSGPPPIRKKRERDEIPGPGAYDAHPEIFYTSPGYSLRGRHKEKSIDFLVPGPGTYQGLASISPEGFYVFSRYKSSSAPKISPPTGRRFPRDKTVDIPGPGAYDPRDKFSTTGVYFLSKMKSAQTAFIGNSERSQIKPNNVPGPGSYPTPSEWGQYAAFPSTRRPDRKNGPKSKERTKAETTRTIEARPKSVQRNVKPVMMPPIAGNDRKATPNSRGRAANNQSTIG